MLGAPGCSLFERVEDEDDMPVDEVPEQGVWEIPGVVALYTFEPGEGEMVRDRAGVFDPPLDLQPLKDKVAPRFDEGGLDLTDGGGFAHLAEGGSAQLVERLSTSGTFTIQAYVKITDYDLEVGPARIVGLSTSSSNRLLLLGIEREGGDPEGELLWVSRQRVAVPDESLVEEESGLTSSQRNGLPTLWGNERAGTEATVVTLRFQDGLLELFAGTRRIAKREVSDGIRSWSVDEGHALTIGDEFGSRRQFFGSMAWVAIYDRALEDSEIAKSLSLRPSPP